MIRVILFDWGGVLTVGTHTKSIAKVFGKKYNIPPDRLNDFGKFIDMLDFQAIDLKAVIKKIDKEYGIDISEQEMYEIFDRAIIPNNDVIKLIGILSKKYRLILFSNNNKPTIKLLDERHIDMLDSFEKRYFSCEQDMHKPNANFFLFALKDLDVRPDECLFIDDKERNINAAKSLGIKTILFKETAQLKSKLREYKISF